VRVNDNVCIEACPRGARDNAHCLLCRAHRFASGLSRGVHGVGPGVGTNLKEKVRESIIIRIEEGPQVEGLHDSPLYRDRPIALMNARGAPSPDRSIGLDLYYLERFRR